MAVAHDTASESHTGTTGSASEASFSWTHTPVGTPRGVLVFVTSYGTSVDGVSSVTYGGTAMTAVSGGRAVDTAGEPGSCKTYFLGSSVPTGAQSVVVNRANDATVMYAVAITVTAANDTATAGTVLLQDDGTLAEQSVDDGSPGTNSVRYAALHSGLDSVPSAGANSTALHSIDFFNNVAAAVRETTAGQGARSVGFSSGTSDDRAAVHLAVKETSTGVTVTPTTRALVLSTFAPTVSTPRLVTPATRALVLATFAPAVVVGKTVTPTTRALVLSTFAPTVVVAIRQPTVATYQVFVRTGSTLALLAELGRYRHLSYTRAELEAGSWQLVMALDDWLAYKALVGADPFVARNIIEVLRDPGDGTGYTSEFAGVVLRRTYDAIQRQWTFAGQSLLGLLQAARIVPAAGQQYDAQGAGVAGETAMKHYVADHFQARVVPSLFTTATFEVEASSGRGDSATYQGYNGRWQSALDATVEIGRAAKLLHRVVLRSDYSGYRYEVYEPRDRTMSATSPVTFSTEFLATELRYEQDLTKLTNTLYALGTGSGAARVSLLVSDAASQGADGRREGYIDARDADTDGRLMTAAQAEMASRLADSEQVSATPSLTGPWRYRRDYDLGDEVTVALPEIGVEVERRIAEVRVTLEGARESLALTLGLTHDAFGAAMRRIALRSQAIEVA